MTDVTPQQGSVGDDARNLNEQKADYLLSGAG
jgi:hypothetical protein